MVKWVLSMAMMPVSTNPSRLFGPGKIVIADINNHAIRTVSLDVVTTIAGLTDNRVTKMAPR